MHYLTDAASPSASRVQTESADDRWSGNPRLAAGQGGSADGWASGTRLDQHDANLDAARGIAIAILLALPVWGAVAVAVRWLLAS